MRAIARMLGAAAVLATIAPAAHGAVELKSAFAQPVTPGSICTAEPRDAIYVNTAYDPADRTDFFNNYNRPSTDDAIVDLAAGAHADLCLGYTLTPDFTMKGINSRSGYTIPDELIPDPSTNKVSGDDQRNIIVDLPVGSLGNLAAAGVCTNEQFGKDGTDFDWTTFDFDEVENGPAQCPANSQIGEAGVRASTDILGVHSVIQDPIRPTRPLRFNLGQIFNLEHGPNELGRLGVQITPPVGDAPSKFVIRLTLVPDGSGRVRSTVLEAPRFNLYNDVLDLYIETVTMRIWGSQAAHPTMPADFSESGTQCGVPARLDVDVTTHGGPPAAAPATLTPVHSRAASQPFTLSGCEALGFQPGVDVATSEQRPGVPTAVTVKLALGQDEQAGRVTALLKDAAVTLPAGLELGAQAGTDGLALCTAAQFNAAAPLAPGACPAATQAATVQILSPLIGDPLVGKAYLGEQSAVGELPALYLEAAVAGATAPDAPRIKLVGQVTADGQGRITTTFEDNPQLRFSELRLDFPGGPNALFSTPRTCGTHTGVSQLRSYAREDLVPATSSLTIDEGCELPAFTPTVSIAASNAQAGASSPTQITIERPDRSPWLDAVKVSLPSGFLADLHVPTECAAAAAATGACPESSRIAKVSVLSGAGEQPLPLEGRMYLTEREAGAVAGAVIVVRAKIGELDLGDVVVPGRINLRPTDAGLDFVTDMPTRFKGLALQLRKVVVDMDREGFALNPSACGPVGYSAIATGDGGETATPSGAASYTGCGNLPFKPSLQAKLTGEIKPGGHPGMLVQVAARAGDSNLRATTVVLPEGVAADLKNVQSPCARADFDAGQCPASTKVGTTVANVAIAPEAIPGDVYLVRVPGETLPGLGLNFTGRFAQRVMSVVKIDKTGRLITIFDQIPDLPLRRLTVDITSSPKGPLQLPPGECAANTRWDATFTGQGGQTSTDQTGLRCADKSMVKLSDRGGLTLRNFDFGGRNLKSAKVTLPAGWSFNVKRAKYGKHSWARTTGSSTRRKFTRRSMTITTRGATASTLRLKVYGTAISKRSKSKRAKTVTVSVRFVFADGAVQTQAIRVKAR